MLYSCWPEAGPAGAGILARIAKLEKEAKGKVVVWEEEAEWVGARVSI